MAALPRHLLPRHPPPRLTPLAHGASHVHDSHVHDTPADAPPPADPPATRPQLPLLSAILHDRVRAADVQSTATLLAICATAGVPLIAEAAAARAGDMSLPLLGGEAEARASRCVGGMRAGPHTCPTRALWTS